MKKRARITVMLIRPTYLMHEELGLNAHASYGVRAAVNAQGPPRHSQSFATSEAALMGPVRSFRVRHNILALEESSRAGWIAGILRRYGDQLMVCDRRYTARIRRGGRKDEVSDAFQLCRWLRRGERVPVYPTHPEHRADFKIAAQPYRSVQRPVTRLTTQIKAPFRQAGVVRVTGTEVFSPTHRDRLLKQVPSKARREIISRL